MKKILTLISISIILSNFNLFSKENKMKEKTESNRYLSGFEREISGETLRYKSFHSGTVSALLIRSLNNSDKIIWETQQIPETIKEDYITFAWISSYAVGTSDGRHRFSLFVENEKLFDFEVGNGDKESDWKIQNNGYELKFSFMGKDNNDDHSGYMFLKIPAEKLNGKRSLKISVKGDGSGSRAWYMTFKYKLQTGAKVTPEYALIKNKDNKKMQRVKILTDYFNETGDIKILLNGTEKISGRLKFGINEFIMPVEINDENIQSEVKTLINGEEFTAKIKLNEVKPFTVYILPHSHVDLGYTALQTEVEKKQIKNMVEAIEIINKTKDYPEGSRFKWNPEVMWPVKCYLEKADKHQKNDFLRLVKEGYIGLDGLFLNELTGLCRPEELIRAFEYSNSLEREYGFNIESFMISDIPGYSWGIVPSCYQNGIKYFSTGPNNFDRIGNTLSTWGDKPFYWKSSSGKERLLVWMAGKGYAWFHGWRLSAGDPSPLLKYLEHLDSSSYPYDMVQVRYTIGGDNGCPDPKLSDFIKTWNEKHETPKIKLATTQEMFRDFESKYGNKIPEYSGDFTPYWEDGAASTAKETAVNRRASERLIQSEILQSLIDINSFSFNKMDQAWENILLFTEHTWGAYNSVSDPETDFVKGQWAMKKAYGDKADSLSMNILKSLMNNRPESNNKSTIDAVITDIKEFRVYNTSSWVRTDVVKIPKEWKLSGNQIFDDQNKPVPTQELNNGEIIFLAENIQGLGYKKFTLKSSQDKNIIETLFKDNLFENKYYSIKFDKKTGAIESLTDKSTGLDLVDRTKEYGINQYIYTGRNAADPRTATLEKIEVLERGPIYSSVELTLRAPGCESLRQEIRLYNHLKKIDIVNKIIKSKNYEKENIRFAYPLNIKEGSVKMDIPWSVVRPEYDQLEGANKNFFTIQRWIDVSNNDYGVILSPIDAPLIEIGKMTGESYMFGEEQRWSKEAINDPTIYSWVMNNSWHTNYKASQEGEMNAEYSMLPHGKFDYFSAYKFGVENSQPLIPVLSNNVAKNENSLFTIKGDIVLTSLKPSRDKKFFMVRLFNPTKEKQSGTIEFQKGEAVEIFLSRADEANLGKISNRFELIPFEVLTLKIKLK